MSCYLDIVSVLFIWLFSNLWRCLHAEIYTSIIELESLLETQQRVINDIEEYLLHEDKRISRLKKYLRTFRREQNVAKKDISNYVENPINSFTLIKRLTVDIHEIEKAIRNGTDKMENISMFHEELKYPSNEDLTGAAHALTRLQKTYNIGITDFTEGILNGIRYSSPMSTSDCYELGKALYEDKYYENSITWMMETLRKYKEKPDAVNSFDEADILEYISYAYYLLNDIRSAIKWGLKILDVAPNHFRILHNMPHFRKVLEDQEKENRNKVFVENKTRDDEPKMSSYGKIQKYYQILCRGEMALPAAIASKLTCRYLTGKSPFLKLDPIKMEQYYMKPDIFLFHDVMSDDEIEAIKEISKPKFKRAVVKNPNTGTLVPAAYRISKSAWLQDADLKQVARISRRITDFTGLSMESAEALQVANYGIGGQYEPHFDFSRKDERKFLGYTYTGNRIATVLFYMSVVAQGGATVFPELGLTVYPIKNAALFWYNLHPSGEGDLATQHAACPVLRGSKWVSTKWIHESGQELIKLCGLEYQEEGFIRELPQSVPKSSL